MSKKIILILIIVVVLAIALAGGAYLWHRLNAERSQMADEASVKEVVAGFGRALKNVSLLSPMAGEDMEKNYKDFLDPVLLDQWKADSSRALGRLTSSPWPDSIEIESIRKFGSGAYDVSGKIIDMASSGVAGSRAIQIGVVKFGNRWLITGISVTSMKESESWKEYDSNGVLFQYPETLTTKYIFTQEWPPAVKVAFGNFSCAKTLQEVSAMLEATSQKIIDGRIYCVNIKNEGTAGSVYSSYTYTTPIKGKLVSISFVLRHPSCANYGAEQNEACISEREIFDINAIVDQIAKSIKFDLALNEDNSANRLCRRFGVGCLA